MSSDCLSLGQQERINKDQSAPLFPLLYDGDIKYDLITLGKLLARIVESKMSGWEKQREMLLQEYFSLFHHIQGWIGEEQQKRAGS